MYPVKVEPKLYFLVVQGSLKVQKKKKKKIIILRSHCFCLSPHYVSPNVYHAFTLLLVVVLFWWLALLNIKMYLAIVEPNLYFLLAMHCSWKVKKKKKKILRSYYFCLSPHYLSVSLLMSTMCSHYFWLWLCFGG